MENVKSIKPCISMNLCTENKFFHESIVKWRNKKSSSSKENNLGKNDGKSLNDHNLNWNSATEMAKDREEWKNCCKKMSFLSKNLPDRI